MLLFSSVEFNTRELKNVPFILLASNDGKELLPHIIFYAKYDFTPSYLVPLKKSGNSVTAYIKKL